MAKRQDGKLEQITPAKARRPHVLKTVLAMFAGLMVLSVIGSLLEDSPPAEGVAEPGLAENAAPASADASRHFFGRIDVVSVTCENGAVMISGSTDLPDGSQLTVGFDVAGMPETGTYIGVNEHVLVREGEFHSRLVPPNRPEYRNGKYLVEVMFTPPAQSEGVLKIVGKNGEYLGGDHAQAHANFTLLEVVKEISLDLNLGEAYPEIVPAKFQTGSPERAMMEFLYSWQKQDWNSMANYAQKTWRSGQENPADMLEAWFGFKDLMGAEITGKTVTSNVAVDFSVTIRYGFGSQVKSKSITARVIREDAPYSTSPYGEWGVNPSSALREN